MALGDELVLDVVSGAKSERKRHPSSQAGLGKSKALLLHEETPQATRQLSSLVLLKAVPIKTASPLNSQCSAAAHARRGHRKLDGLWG